LQSFFQLQKQIKQYGKITYKHQKEKQKTCSRERLWV